MLDNDHWQKSVRKSADLKKLKSVVYVPTDFHVTLTDLLKKLGRFPPNSESVVSIGGKNCLV